MDKTMSARQQRFVLRAARRANTNKSPATHVTVRKDSLITIIKEAYSMGLEDARKEHE
jgi:hypothetical protein